MEQTKSKNSIWILGLLISVLIGVAVGWMGSHGSVVAFGVPVFAIIIGYAFVLNWIAFVPSFLNRTEKYFDLTGALTYVSATVGAMVLSGNLDTRAWLAGAVVIIWSTRLGTFLFRRIKRDGGDGRFDTMKHDFWQFLMTWTIQGLWVSLTAAAAFVMITAETRVSIGLIGTLGFIVWLIGFSIEVIADRQKSKFKSDPANKGRFIASGLWAWSRHPNYFGEILLWTGVAIMSVPVLDGWRWFALVSPIFVCFLLTKVSGIPILRRRADERWGEEPEYKAYIERTSMLIPLPPKS
jgi:steroid 5-alpha reductase family enzyme